MSSTAVNPVGSPGIPAVHRVSREQHKSVVNGETLLLCVRL